MSTVFAFDALKLNLNGLPERWTLEIVRFHNVTRRINFACNKGKLDAGVFVAKRSFNLLL
jgi:hypothetical protein